jgi:RNA polymerase sigma factor (sigma-70 family)
MSPSSLRHPARLAGASLLRLQSDERLADLAANGHEAAFDAIVDRYRTPLTRYCAGIVGPSRAEDAVQQALINAHDALQRTDEVRHLRSWLYRIAHNAALNVLRAVRDDVSLDAASGAAAVAEDGPAAAFERSERFRATVEALQELPERQRAALVLRELEGRSHEEIAETLGVTKGSARQHLMRARVAVRGAVTAITPYPLIVRLAEMLTSPGTAGWTDVAVGAGAGATLAKLTAGVAATGALVGGAVGTERVVHHRHSGQDAAQRSSGGSATKPRLVKARAVSLPAAGTAASTGSTASGSGHGGGGSGHGASGSSGHGRGKDDRDDHGKDGSSGTGSDNSGRGSNGSGRGPGGHGDRTGATSSHGRGSGGRDDSSGSGRRGDRGDGSRSKDDDSKHGSRGGDSGGSGSSASGSSGSGSRGSSGSGSGGNGSSSGDSSGSSTSGRDSKGSDDNSSSGTGGRDAGDDSSATTTPAATEPTPPIAAPTPTTTPTDAGSGSGSSGGSGSSDGSGSPDHSGSN